MRSGIKSIAEAFGGFNEGVKTAHDMREALHSIAGDDPEAWAVLATHPKLDEEGRDIAKEELKKLRHN